MMPPELLTISNRSLTFVPEEDSWEFAGLPKAAKDKAEKLYDAACMAFNAGPKRRTAVCKLIAQEMGVSFNTVYQPIKNFLTSRDWRTLIDRRLAGSDFWIRRTSHGLPHEFVDFWRNLVESNDRSANGARVILMQRLRDWRSGDPNSTIPGYITPPGNAPGKRHPAGWSYKTLLRLQPSDIEIAAARKGRAEAMKHLPSIFTTRKGGYPCMEYQYDDMWHDFEVIYNGQICRLLEFGACDFYSGFIFNPGLRPRYKNAAGTNESLTEKQFRIWAVTMLATYGWSPRGTTLQGERGTAAFRHLAPKLVHWSGGLLRVPLPGMSGRPAIIGGWRERAKGNPNAKGLKEGLGKLIHNRLAHLPGQVGMNPADLPASAFGRNKEAETLLALQQHVATPLKLTHLTFEAAAFEVVKTYMEINRDPEHDMEGWMEEGLFTQEYHADPANDIWVDIGKLPEENRQALAIIAAASPHLIRPRRLSRLEVISPALQHNIRLSPEAEADCLYEDCVRDMTVAGGHLSFKDAEMGPETFRYFPTYQDRSGFQRLLPTGSEWKVVVNPFNPERAFIFDQRGSYLGIAKRDYDIQRQDVDALHRKIGQKEALYKDSTLAAQARHGLKRESALTENANALIESIRDDVRREMGIRPQTPAPCDLSADYAAADLAPPASAPAVDLSILI